jgi:hypothetical protein
MIKRVLHATVKVLELFMSLLLPPEVPRLNLAPSHVDLKIKYK